MFVFVSARIVKLVFSDHPGARRGDRLVDRLIQVQQDRSQTREKKKQQRQQEQQKQTKKQAKNKPLFSPNSPQKKIICNALRTFQQ